MRRSIGQIAPHEAIGMANYNKTFSSALVAATGLIPVIIWARCMEWSASWGRAANPVRNVLNYVRSFSAASAHRARAYRCRADGDGRLFSAAFFVGDDVECFHRAAELSV